MPEMTKTLYLVIYTFFLNMRQFEVEKRLMLNSDKWFQA